MTEKQEEILYRIEERTSNLINVVEKQGNKIDEIKEALPRFVTVEDCNKIQNNKNRTKFQITMASVAIIGGLCGLSTLITKLVGLW